jgi:hypothetical protein
MLLPTLLLFAALQAHGDSVRAEPAYAGSAAGTEPNDVMVFFGDIDRANSAFGGGRFAPTVARV